jgi:hypothetical protein
MLCYAMLLLALANAETNTKTRAIAIAVRLQCARSSGTYQRSDMLCSAVLYCCVVCVAAMLRYAVSSPM